ncbi:EF-hand domain-containing protein [Rhodobacteraceae bacterium KMM 6894]|nr:EF-hand domain-containing protein [Rhodobacteraceae bacterium KMM 6894]
MTKFIAIVLGMSALATSAFATDAMDSNADGMVTIEEVQAMYPDITAEQFSEADANADGSLDADEIQAAQDVEILPAS